MQVVTAQLSGDGFEARVTSHRADGWIAVEFGGVIIARWPENDTLLANTFMAAALRLGWQGKTIAQLAFTSPPVVSRLRARLALGHIVADLIPGQPGRPRSLTPEQVKKAKALRGNGQSFAAIATTLAVSRDAIVRLLRGVPAGSGDARPEQGSLLMSAPDPNDAPRSDAGPASDNASAEPPAEIPAASSPAEDAPSAAPPSEQAPRAGDVIEPDGEPHESRFAGAALINAAASALALSEVLDRACAQRPEKAVYPAVTVVHALCAAWSAGHPSLESMHEEDPFALGVILGLSRAPSVRTLHRAITQMTAAMDPVQLWAASMTALMRARPPEIPVFGIDGHFKAYAGDAPIDKGWNAKRRIMERGLATVRVNDLLGHTFSETTVPAGESLHGHVLLTARALDAAQASALGDAATRPTVLAFDRGGFSFDVLNDLAAEGFWYLAWIPDTVRLPPLEPVAPREDGVGEAVWTHPSLTHPSRLVVTRDGDALIPATSNLPPWVDAVTVMALLRGARGMQENAIKAARAFAHIDRLSDRGVESERPDDRPVANPERTRLVALRAEIETRAAELTQERGQRERRPLRDITLDQMVLGLQMTVVREQLAETPRMVERSSLEAEARRAALKVEHRQLVLPLKNHLENGRRWLLAALGASLSPSDHEWDQDTRLRTLTAMLRAPGTLRFYEDHVAVELRFPLPPMPHERLSRGLAALDECELRFPDGRHVRFRLAPRPVRELADS